MELKDVKRRVIACIEEGAYDHEVRYNIDVKNRFQCGLLSDSYVIDLIDKTSEKQYRIDKHHRAPSIDVHILKPTKDGIKWYIKFYFVEPDVVFISVHENEV